MRVHNLIVGIDLNRTAPQLCYYDTEHGDSGTAPLKAGNEEISFREVLDACEKQVGDNLYEDAESVRQEQEVLADKTAGMLRQALATLGLEEPGSQISGMMITVPVLSRALVNLIQGVYRRLDLESSRAFLQDYKESFYYHTLYQKQELWSRNVGFFLFQDRDVSFFSLSSNHMTRPVTVTVESGMTVHLNGDASVWDSQFCRMVDDSLRQNLYSAVFLMGDTFDKTAMSRSTALLCKGGRKVFVVDNLFARGACCGAREKTVEKRLAGYLYLGDELIRNNVGMQMTVQGTKTFYPLISAGVNWYEAERDCEILLVGEPELIFTLSGMDGRNRREVRMELPGLPQRPPRTNRLHLRFSFESAHRMMIEVQDIGFGEMFPGTGQIWREELKA
ncbi:MAG: DUF5716 family protein [Lachnospiraceae bacterium]|nr:DUF5716 family protein [Lachnospiraceae bacterium]